MPYDNTSARCPSIPLPQHSCHNCRHPIVKIVLLQAVMSLLLCSCLPRESPFQSQVTTQFPQPYMILLQQPHLKKTQFLSVGSPFQLHTLGTTLRHVSLRIVTNGRGTDGEWRNGQPRHSTAMS